MNLKKINKNLDDIFYKELCNKIIFTFKKQYSKDKNIVYISSGCWASIYKVVLKDKKNLKIKIQFYPSKELELFKRLPEKRNIDLELLILKESHKLVKKNITCHLPLFYNKIDCNQENKKFSIFVSELSDDVMTNWVKKKHTDTEWKSFLFQILSTLHVFKNNLKFFHNDLNLSNILFNYDNNKGFYEYKINNDKYYLPTTGFIFLIWDFANGYSLLHKNEKKYEKFIKDKLKNNTDFDNINNIFLLMKMYNIYKCTTFNELKN